MQVFDAHVHVIDPRFPLVPNQGFVPGPFDVPAYRSAVAGAGLDLLGGALVAGSFQGTDQRWLTTALAELGPGWAGVAQLPADVPDAEVLRLAAAGVRAVRFNLARGTAPDAAALVALAHRVHDLAGWGCELYVDSGDLAALAPVLRQLPRVGVDHLGMSGRGTTELLRLVDGGARVKATGFGRVDLDVAATLRAVHAVDPTALLFGTDLPGTRARRPFAPADVELLIDALGEQALPAVLRDNARAWYRLG
ncbi:amidohydrolase family protein [Modestobacter sp. NPDC049651]|uniref:amidohydrolase family protein n=1 Tax=unclassified Modestobacter TaxID=2643866 RepID=UPI0033C4A412